MKYLKKFDVELHQTKLQNGVNLFLFKRKGMPIHLRAIFFAGSRFDDISGIAHFLEHMLTAGTAKFPSKNLIANYMQRIGGDFGANTDTNMMRFILDIPEAQDIDVGTEILSEALTKSLLEETVLETERGAIISELNIRKSNPKEYVRDVSRGLTFAGTSSGRSILGEESDVKSIQKDNLLRHKDAFIHAGRLNIIASGDIDIDILVEKLNKVNLPIGDIFKPTQKLPVTHEKTIEIENYPGVKQLQVVLSCRTAINDYKEYCAFRVLQHILSAGRGSRLMTKLRYKNGLIYTVSSSIQQALDWGIFRVSLSCDKENFEKTKDLIFKEFELLKKEGVTNDELEKTKLKISKGQIRQMQTSESWVSFHEFECISSSKAPHTVEDYIETTEQITLEDMQNVINKYLDKEKFFVAICGDM